MPKKKKCIICEMKFTPENDEEMICQECNLYKKIVSWRGNPY